MKIYAKMRSCSLKSLFLFYFQTRRPRLSLIVSLLVFLWASNYLQTQAQNVQYTNQAIDIGARSVRKVNPTTRGVELQIPLGHYRGRAGLDVPVTLSYSSKVWNVEFQGYDAGAPPPHGTIDPFTIVTADFAKHSIAGWTSSIGLPVVDFLPQNRIYDAFGNPNVTGNCNGGCYAIDRILVWMPDGSGHELRASDQPRPTTQAAPDNYYAIDATRMRYQKSTSTLYMPDGSQYQLANGTYVDRNGNTLTSVGGWQDTLNRTINNPLPYNPGQGPLSPTDQTYTLPGVGTSMTYTLKWRNLGDVLTTAEPVRYIADGGCPPGLSPHSPYLFQSDSGGRTCFGNAGVLFNPVVLSQIVLPNGQAYTFTYDIFGAINKVIIPTGGYEKFESGYVPPISSPTNFKFVYAQVNRGVTTHVVSPSGSGGDEAQWLYGGAGNFVSVTAPDNTRTERYMWTDGVSGWGYSADSARAGMAYDERVYSSSGQMVRRKLTDWVVTPSNASGSFPGTQAANRNARIAREVEIILDTSGPALAKSKTYHYDLTYQYDVGVEQTVISEFAYVNVDQNTAQTLPIGSLASIPNGTRLRSTEFDYLTSDNNYRSRNILGRVKATRIKNGSDLVIAQSTNVFDEAAYPLLTYASVTGWTDPGTPYRGNATTSTTWLNFNGTSMSTFPQGTTLSTHAQYDQCGSVRKTWDARDVSLSNPALIDYSSTYQRAYPTTQTTADPDGGGPLTPLTTTSEYDFSTGLVTATVDANSQRTSFTYNDPLNRLKQIVRAETDATLKNQTSIVYDDVARTVTTTSDRGTYNDNVLKTVALYDGLGRLQETRRYDSPSSYISVQQQFDGLGRAYKTSNPYRPLQGDALLWTTQQFDFLGRLLSVTTPDTAVVSTSYDGSTITATEQTGKQRKSIRDSLGRLIQIFESPNDGTLNYETDYQYDALDNLVKITQGTQSRYFMYDSLRRVIRDQSPEQNVNASLNLTDPVTLNSSWSRGYQYDNNGNLTQRVDPRNVVTTYTQDALNRNLTVSYSNDPSGTASVTNIYDAAANGKGRLYQSQAANTSLTTIDSYDGLGRPVIKRQQFYVNGNWGQSYTTQRSYDLAGGVISQIYPSNRIVNYVYDDAERVSTATGSLGDGITRTYATEITYSSAGGLSKEKFGTNTPVYNKLFYNSRGQLAEIRTSTSYTGPSDTTWNRGAIINHYSEQCWGMCGGNNSTTAMTDNNGNLKKQEVYVPNDDQISGYTMRWQQYDYDSLNRLNWAREIKDNVEQWKQQFTYDRWGNRTINTAVTYGTGINNKAFTVDTSNNRLGVPSGQSGVMTYDAAGNLTNDTYTGAGNRTYDAENKITSAWGGDNLAQLYAYNASGQRIKRTVNGVETWQIYGFGGELLAEYAANGAAASPQKEYGYRNGQLLITADGGTTQAIGSTPNAATFVSQQVPQTMVAGHRYAVSVTFRNSGSNTWTTANMYNLGVAFDSGTWGLYRVALPYSVAPNQEVTFNFSVTAPGIPGNYNFQWRMVQDTVEWFGDYSPNVSVAVTGASANGANAAQCTWQNVPSTMVAGQSYTVTVKMLNTGTNTWTTANMYNLGSANDNGAWGLYRVALPSSIAPSQEATFTFAVTAPSTPGTYIFQWRMVQDTVEWFGDASTNVSVAVTTQSTPQVHWLVTDQLGTPRMVLDQTGSLANVKRHDYLPFGEELFAPTSGRNAVQGYASGDGVRQRYTAKERDLETNLDFFGSRYYSSAAGRFTSPDLFAGRKGNPQTLNRYSYAKNNPLRYIDPFGYSEQDPKKDCPDCENTPDNPQLIIKTNSSPEKPGFFKRAFKAIGRFFARAVESYGESQAREAQDDMRTAAATLDMVAQVAPVAREIAESDPQIMGMTKDIPIFSPEGMAALDDASALMLEEADSLSLLLETSGVPNAGGVIRSFVLEHDEIFYRVFSSKPFGGFLTKVPPTSSAAAREALALPPNNQATYIQEVIVPAGTRLQRSRALPAFGRQGGAEQFELLDHIPTSNFGMPRKLE